MPKYWVGGEQFASIGIALPQQCMQVQERKPLKDKNMTSDINFGKLGLKLKELNEEQKVAVE